MTTPNTTEVTRSIRVSTFGRLALLLILIVVSAACSTQTDPTDTGSTDPDQGRDAVQEADPDRETGPDTDTDTDADADADTGDGSPDQDKPSGDNKSQDASGDRSDPIETQVEPVQWADCGDGFDCGSVAVPRNHDDPTGPSINIAVIRRPATGTARGSILVNPGGPGASGVNYVRGGFTLDADTMDDYDLVGFDPRGIGASGPLQCQLDLTDGPRPDFSPDSTEELAELDDEARSLATRCSESDGDLLPHLGTESVIADLDMLRRAVGDDQLNYLGLSYGTLIGLRYAERWPDRVGRMVLDGLVDPNFALPDLLRQQALEFERAFAVLDEACGPDLPCPDGGMIAGYDAVLEELERSGRSGQVGPAELQVATLVTMYSERLWPQLGEALQAAQAGDLSPIERLHDLYVGGTSYTSYAAVSCIDSRSPSGGEAWDAFAAELDDLAPRFGAALANELRTCAYWPVTADTTPAPVTAAGAPPILLLSTTGDAATPVANAFTVAESLTDASLVLINDEGHTAYGRSFCVERIVSAYFDSGELPGDIHRC